MKKVLVLEDEANIRSFVVINLRRSGYEPIEADCGEMALEQLRRHPDIRVALLDVMLPDIDGFEVCRRIRASNTRIGIIMLTARNQEMDKVTGLMTGADDYVTKPFSPPGRPPASTRSSATPAARTPRIPGRSGREPFRLNTRNRTLEKNGERVRLTQIGIFPSSNTLWTIRQRRSPRGYPQRGMGPRLLRQAKIVDVNIRRLRIKIEDDPTMPAYITAPSGATATKWGLQRLFGGSAFHEGAR